MAYQALYRLWRPQTFHDVVGQEHITKTLQNALLQEKVSHAYLFSGPRGTGKTSAAKIFAKAINCENGPVLEPCNQCSACKGITDGSISDVLEIDAASNNGVDEIREIRDKVKYAPSSVRYKVYIIDEVHMLSIGAFNALLKTLEEPPKHVIFILATTEPHKIPLTIISRCQRFEFHKIANKYIIGRLQTVIDSQEIKVEEEALQIIARVADGGMRDALSLLDQAISYGDEVVTVSDVLAVTGSVAQQHLHSLVQHIYERNTASALQLIDEMMNDGKEPLRLVEDLIFYYRDMLLYQTSPTMVDMLERVIVDDTFIQLSEGIEATAIYEMIQQLSKSQQEMKWTNHPRVFLEVAIVKLSQQVAVQSAAVDHALVQKIEHLEKEIQVMKQSGVPVQQAAPESQEKRPARSARGAYKAPIGRIQEVLKQATRNELEGLKSIWGEVLARLSQKNRAHEALLRNTEPVAASEQAYVLGFVYEIHCKMVVDNQELLVTLQSLLQELTGKSLQMLAIPNDEWASIREAYLKQDPSSQEEQEPEKEDDNLIVTEAMKLVGEDLLEIKE